jgi:hypothetical protein
VSWLLIFRNIGICRFQVRQDKVQSVISGPSQVLAAMKKGIAWGSEFRLKHADEVLALAASIEDAIYWKIG